MRVDRTTVASESSTGLQLAGHTHRLDLERRGNREQGGMTRGTFNQYRDGALHRTISRTREGGREGRREGEWVCILIILCRDFISEDYHIW